MISFYFRHRIDPHSGASLLIGSQQSLTATAPEIVVPGLASGATYTMAIKVRTTMGDSDYSPPTVSSTIMEQTDLERFRATLNLDAIENKIASQTHSIDQVKSHLDAIENKIASQTQYIYDSIDEVKSQLSSRITSQTNSIDQVKSQLSSRITSQTHSIDQIKNDLSRQTQRMTSQTNSIDNVKNDLSALRDTAVTTM